MVMIPLRLPHRFSNPFDGDAIFMNTTSPAHYVRYFAYLEELVGEGTELTPEVNARAMLKYGTVPLGDADVKLLEEEASGKRGKGNVNGEEGKVDGVVKVEGEGEGHGVSNGV